MTISYREGPQTERLVHRAFVADDAAAMFRFRSDPDIMRYTGERPLGSVEEARRAIAEYTDFERVGFGRWACVLKETQSIVGFCGLKYLEEFDEVDIGYRFLPSHWGQGLATEASLACLAFGFQVMGLQRIVAYVMPANTASVRVLEKTGMTFEAEVDYDGIPALRYAKAPS